jgi:hypothetical protein
VVAAPPAQRSGSVEAASSSSRAVTNSQLSIRSNRPLNWINSRYQNMDEVEQHRIGTVTVRKEEPKREDIKFNLGIAVVIHHYEQITEVRREKVFEEVIGTSFIQFN